MKEAKGERVTTAAGVEVVMIMGKVRLYKCINLSYDH